MLLYLWISFNKNDNQVVPEQQNVDVRQKNNKKIAATHQLLNVGLLRFRKMLVREYKNRGQLSRSCGCLAYEISFLVFDVLQKSGEFCHVVKIYLLKSKLKELSPTVYDTKLIFNCSIFMKIYNTV